MEAEAHAPKEGAERPRKEPREDVYLAHLWAYGRVAKGEKRKKGEPPPSPFRLLLGDGEASLPLPPKFHGQRMVAHLDRPVLALYWPRTDEEGLLEKPFLAYLKAVEALPPEAGRPTFLVRGRLLAADRDAARVVVEVRPNPQGRLKEPFRLTLLAPLALLEGLPPPGTGVEVRGVYAPRTRRLVAQEARAVRLWDDPAEGEG